MIDSAAEENSVHEHFIIDASRRGSASRNWLAQPSNLDHAAVIAHTLLNAVAGVRVCLDTLCDDDIVLSSCDRSWMHDTAVHELERISDALRRIVRGASPV